MIATLTMTMGQRQVVATLEEYCQWRCEDRLTESFLNAVYGPDAEQPTGVSRTGQQLTCSAARAVEQGGWSVEVWFAEAEQDAA